MKIKMVPQPYRRMDYLEKDLRRAEQHQREYRDNCRWGTDPVLVKLHETNVRWRQQIIDRRLAHPYSKPRTWSRRRQHNEA